MPWLRAPPAFDLVGVHWQGPGDVLFRTRSTARPLDRVARGDARAARPSRREHGGGPVGATWKLGNPFWVGPSNAIQYRLRGRVTRLRASFVQSTVQSVPLRTLSIAGSPRLTPRAAWGANEAIRRGSPLFAQSLKFAVMHHTAGTNSYTAAQSAAIVRGIQTYHVKSNGWNDLGYNFVVDKYGQVFEGRYGGVERNVVGAHAEGFNTGSVGIALLGTYGDAQPSAKALDAIASLLAWRLDVGHVDPLSAGSPGSPAATRASRRARRSRSRRWRAPRHRLHVVPGQRPLPSAADARAQGGGDRPAQALLAGVTGRIGASIRFTARLSTVRPWSVPGERCDGRDDRDGPRRRSERRLDVGRDARGPGRLHVRDRGGAGHPAGDGRDRADRDRARR